MVPKLLPAALASAAACLAFFPSAAFGGRMMATGHDADFHCWVAQPNCAFLDAAVKYVRDGAPNTTLKVLVITNQSPKNRAEVALTTGLGVPNDRMPPTTPLTGVLNTNDYSAIVVASSSKCGGCDLVEPHDLTDFITLTNRAAIRAFFNDGGGVLALSGAGDFATYYGFAPLPVGGVAVVQKPFAPTSLGNQLGLTTASVNCCPTHNTFTNPMPLQVAETDNLGRAETVVAEGTVSGPASAPKLTPLATAPAGLDHFECYSVASTPFRTRRVSLRDQFGTKRARVRAPRELCNPVAKTVRGRTTGVRNAAAHLVCHGTLDAPAAVKSRSVRLRNQFGQAVVTRTSRPEMLCAPSRKRIGKGPIGALPSGVLDHFRCYRVTPRPAGRTVRLKDQFANRKALVRRLFRLCNPVAKRHRGTTTNVRRPAAHLACYTITTAKAKPRDVVVRNQFGVRGLRASVPRTLCLPTFKQILPLVPPTPPVVVPPPPTIRLDLDAAVCRDPRDRFVFTLTGATEPARDGTVTAALYDPFGMPGPSVTERVSGGRFSVRSETGPSPGRYTWDVFVEASEEEPAQGTIDVDAPRDPPSC